MLSPNFDVAAPCVAYRLAEITRSWRDLKDQSPDDIRMVGAISARWMGSVEGQAVVWKTAQTECTSHAMGLQDCDRATFDPEC
jgi:hypothetical protein